MVTAEDFSSVHCRAIFEAAKAIAESGGVIDPVSIRDLAARNGVELPHQYLSDLMDCVPTNASCFEYAKRVAADARKRRIADQLTAIQENRTATADEVLVQLQNLVAEQKKTQDVRDNTFLSLFKPLSEFEEEEAEWLIPGWIPKGQITLIVADGGIGKTTLWVNILAALSSGGACILDPPGTTRDAMKLVFCTTEDSVKKKLRKKLRKAGADMSNVMTMDPSADKTGLLGDFKFGSDKMKELVSYYSPAACVFDPVQGFVPPDINMGSRNAMRDCMSPLISLGEDKGTSFIVICHTNKRKGAYGRDRVSDSSDLWDIARSVIMAGYTEEQGIRYLSNEKNNYAQLQETVLFSINESGQIVREGTSWKRDKDYVLGSVAATSAPKKDDCKDFIIHLLQESPDGCINSEDLMKQAQNYGYAFMTIKRARQALVNESVTENYYLGVKGQKGRKCFVRFKKKESLPDMIGEMEQLPIDTPVPFHEGVREI